MIEINNILDVEKYIDGVDAVIFDLDDTLYSEKDYVRSGFKLIADSFNMPGLEQELWNSFEQGGKAVDIVFADNNIINRKDEALLLYRNQAPIISLFPGVKEILNRIKDSGRKLGLITDGRPEGQHAKIKALNLEPIFDKIIITDELGGVDYRKPNPKAFILMRDEFDLPFEKMVYIGDNASKDFIAPQKLGIKQIHFINKDGIHV